MGEGLAVSAKGVLGAIALAAVLAFGFGNKDESEAAPAPEPAPVPLAISETTPPPGWVAPAPEPVWDELTAEEQLAALLSRLGDVAPWQLGGGLAVLAVIAALTVALERSRNQ